MLLNLSYLSKIKPHIKHNYQKCAKWILSLMKILSTAKLFERLRKYLQFFSALITNFYCFMLVINSIKLKDRDSTNIYCIKLYYIWVFCHELSKMLEYFFYRLYNRIFLLHINAHSDKECTGIELSHLSSAEELNKRTATTRTRRFCVKPNSGK